MPRQLCHTCVSNITTFLPFLKLCQESVARWSYLSERLLDISIHTKATTAFIFVTDSVRTVVEHRDKKKNLNMKNVKARINRISKETKRPTYRKTVPIEELERVRQWKLKVYTCVECGSKYRQLHKINQHLANQNQRLCRHCYKIVNLKTFGEHLQTHMIPFFKCEVCGLPFNNKEQLEKHKQVHKGRNMCVECKRTFVTADMLTLHVHRRHEADVCNTCDKKFSNRICLYKHRSKCRTQKLKKYICDHCSKEFNVRNVLKSHITLVHDRMLMHQCEQCGKKFNSACHLEEHYETHDIIPDRFKCQYCDKVYSTSGSYRRHLRQRHYSLNPALKKRDYSCDVCKKSFISEKYFKNHLQAKNHKDKYLRTELTMEKTSVKNDFDIELNLNDIES